MANDKRTFSCLPRRMFSDTRPSALDIRFCGAVALHDGMSLVTGKGAGCYASMKTLSEEVGCDYTSGSRSLSRLLRWGYIVREPQIYDKRKFALRVVYEVTDSLQDRQLSRGQEVGEIANEAPQIVDEPANNPAEIVGRDFSEPRRNLPETASQYISLNEEIDFVETSEINSAKRRDLRFDDFADDGFSDQAEVPSGDVERAWQEGIQTQGGAPTEIDLIGDIGRGTTVGAALAQYERLLKSVPETMNLIECQAQLSRLQDDFPDDNQLRFQIERLWEATWVKHSELQDRPRGKSAADNVARRWQDEGY